MFVYEKKLQYPVKIRNCNPKLASIVISQYGGPDGELGASLRYLSQRYSMPYPELKGLLTDIGTDASEMLRYGQMLRKDGYFVYTAEKYSRISDSICRYHILPFPIREYCILAIRCSFSPLQSPKFIHSSLCTLPSGDPKEGGALISLSLCQGNLRREALQGRSLR